MKERTLRVLEFTRIREMLAEGALTEAGAEKCRALEPADDLAAIFGKHLRVTTVISDERMYQVVGTKP